MKRSPHQLKTVNVVENADGNVSITAFADTKEGRKAALEHFHDLLFQYDQAEDEDLTIEEIKGRFPRFDCANWTNEAGDYDILIALSE